MERSIKILINGNSRILPNNTTIRELAATENKWDAPFVLFVNGVHLPAKEYEAFILKEGDEVRIVYIMGGG